MSPGFERLAAKAHSDQQLKFTSLAHHITAELLQRNVLKIPLSSSAGVDRMSVSEARKQAKELARDTIDAIHRQGYRPPPVRRVFIPKPGKSELRPIGVPTVWDRAVQRSCAQVLEAIYEQDFLNYSYGGRPGRNCHQALGYLSQKIANGKVSWVMEADLKNFFGSLCHKHLLKFVEHRVGDPRITCLIRRWLKAGVMEEGTLKASESGTPQGGSISVILSNIYLHYVLDLWFEKVVKPRLKGEAYMVRYLDDFVVCFQYHTDAVRFHKALVNRLAKFRLELEPSKTRTVPMGKFADRDCRAQGGRKAPSLVFLGFTLYGMRYPWGYFGLGFKPAGVRVNRFLSTLKEDLRQHLHRPLAEQQQRINQKLRGFYNYFGLPLCSAVLAGIYRCAVIAWRRTLSKRSQSGRLNWAKFNEILKVYPLLRPKLKFRHAEFLALSMQQLES